MAEKPRGYVTFDSDECKGCAMCVEVCPSDCISLSPDLNQYGVHPAQYSGHGCTGCGICFYCCPEPGGITVYKTDKSKAGAA